MAKLERPDNDHDMLYEVWYAIKGANGDGVAEIAKQNREDIREIKEVIPRLMTTEEHIEYHDDHTDRERRKKWRTTDVFFGATMLFLVAAELIKGLF